MSPNQISVLSLLCGLACAVLFAVHSFFLGAVMLFISGILDLVDGTVARKLQKETEFGAVFDWIIDKYVDGLALLGIGLSGIPSISLFLPVGPIADFGMIAIAIFGSMMVSYTRARAEGLGISPQVGIFERFTRIVLLIAGSVFGPRVMSYIIIILGIGTIQTTIQRMIFVRQRSKKD
jgi:archaetidylinositol phosphate synthase